MGSKQTLIMANGVNEKRRVVTAWGVIYWRSQKRQQMQKS